MMWSKLKKRIESRFFDEAKGRVELFQTSYRKSHDQEGEYWLTIDGEKIHGVGTLSFFKAEYLLSQTLSDNNLSGDLNSRDRQILIRKKLVAQGVMGLGEFNSLMRESLNMSVGQMIESDYPIIRALAVLDGRFGKRSLDKVNISGEHPLVKTIYEFRTNLN